MKTLFITIFSCIIIYSCAKNQEPTKSQTVLAKNSSIKNTIEKEEPPKVNIDCPLDSMQMQTSEYKGTRFFTEKNLRGSGVINFSIEKNIDVLNLDKSLFGKIVINNDEVGNSVDIKLPKTVIAREIIPNEEFQVFSFDAENPASDKIFLVVYINKEKKLISKKDNKYNYNSWENYAKSAYIQLTPAVKNSTSDEQQYWYKALIIKGDSMQIKSVPKTNCDYIEKYKDLTKWIQWKNNSCKTIKFNFCY